MTRRTAAALVLPFLVLLGACSAAVEEEPTTSGSSEDDLTKEPSLTFGTWKSVTCEPVDADTFQLRTYRIAANGVFANVTTDPLEVSAMAAKFAIAELELGIIFDGWDAAGEPVGRPRSRERDGATPWVQIAAVSLDQTDNTYGALLELLTENDSSAADALGLDPGDTRTVRRSNHRARIDKVTASAGAREGQPITAAVIDESHLYLPSNGGKKLAATIRRNAAKMGGFTLETTNNYDPSLETVAQATDEAVGDKAEGIYQWKPQAPHVMSLADTRSPFTV